MLVLAGTIGTTVAITTVIDATLWAPMPMADTARTVVIWQQDTSRGTPIVEVGRGETEGWAGDPAAPLASVAVFSSGTRTG